jgi:hypothetical protein
MNKKDIIGFLESTGKDVNEKNLKHLLHSVEKANKKAMIVSKDGNVITVFNKKNN